MKKYKIHYFTGLIHDEWKSNEYKNGAFIFFDPPTSKIEKIWVKEMEEGNYDNCSYIPKNRIVHFLFTTKINKICVYEPLNKKYSRED